MRRLGCAVLILLCLVSSASAGTSLPQPTPAAYFWDLNDREIVSVSSGTGGLVSRADEPLAFDLYADYNPFWHNDRSEISEYLARVTKDADTRRFLTEWAGQVSRELWGEAIPYDDLDRFDYAFCGNLLQCKAEESGFIRTAVYDLANHKQLSLSDFFYDNYNYIDYINRTLASYPHEDFMYFYMYGMDSSVYRTFDLEDQEIVIDLSESDFDTVYSKRPFTGLPRDYPLFIWTPGTLFLYVEDYNPFWTTDPGLLLPIFEIPLSHDISPWPTTDNMPESVYMQFRFERVEAVQGQTLFFPFFDQVDGAPAPEALNAALLATLSRASETADWTNAPRHHGWPFYRQDQQNGDYVSVAFVDWYKNIYYDIPYDAHTILYAADIYSLQTGAAVNLSALYAAARQQPETVYYPEPSLDILNENHGFSYFEERPPIEPEQDYQAPVDAAASDAWLIRYWDPETDELKNQVVVRFETPGGEKMRLVTPFSMLENIATDN